jgi:hypothetical protein
MQRERFALVGTSASSASVPRQRGGDQMGRRGVTLGFCQTGTCRAERGRWGRVV